MFVEIDNLSFAYDPGGKALDGVSLVLRRGECLGMAGGPGAGKSTLALILAGMLPPGGGRVAVDGREIGAGRADRRFLSALVGYVPQNPERQLFAATVAEDVGAGLKAAGVRGADAAARVDAALTRVGLDPGRFRGRPPLSLSGGEARKAALAGIIVLERPVLVFDEPTAGLDARARREFGELSASLKAKGHTLVIISHRPEDYLPIADRLLVLADGRTRFFGTVAEALADGSLEADGSIEWPPLTRLLLRLGKHYPGIGAAACPPEAAVDEILRNVRDERTG